MSEIEKNQAMENDNKLLNKCPFRVSSHSEATLMIIGK